MKKIEAKHLGGKCQESMVRVCTGKRYVERETSLASLEREGGTFQGSLCSPLKSGGFLGRETSLACLRERRALFRARFARLSKVVVFLALLGAPVRGM